MEDSITLDYQAVLNASVLIRNSPDRNAIWQRYMDMHMAIERVMLDHAGSLPTDASLSPGQGLRRPGDGAARQSQRQPERRPPVCQQQARPVRGSANTASHTISVRSRWVGKSGLAFVTLFVS